MEFHKKTRIALHETPLSSEHIMRAISLYDPFQFNSKSGVLL